MKIEIAKGKKGKDDKIILFTSTDKNNAAAERERVTIFKVALLVNQLTYNELKIENGIKKEWLKRGYPLFFEEAIKGAIEMAKDDINWAETHNWELILEWAKKWQLSPESIELELRRTFQKGLDEFGN